MCSQFKMYNNFKLSYKPEGLRLAHMFISCVCVCDRGKDVYFYSIT